MKKSAKRIWITTDWEPNPLQEGRNRLGRMNRLAVYLARQGYEVTVWFTTYEHPTKQYIETRTTCHRVEPNLQIVTLHCPIPYKRNVSPIRFVHLGILAAEMKRLIRNETAFPCPDIIFCAWPPEQYCRVSLAYGKTHGIPIIVDARDLWPDIFSRAVPKLFSRLADVLLYPMRKKTASTFRAADALCAISPAFLSWALNYANRDACTLDKCIFIANERIELPQNILDDELKKWNRIGISSETWNICLFASLSGHNLDMETLFDAVQKAHNDFPQIRLVIGGKGDQEAYYRKLAADRPYIHLMGWLHQEQMISLMMISKAGMMSYHNTVDFKDGWGNKVGQYLSYGLPLITSATGVAKDYIKKYDCGIPYEEGNMNQLACIFAQLIESPDLQKQLSCKAYERFQADFDAKMVNRQFEDMINNALRSHYFSISNAVGIGRSKS